MSNTSTKKRWLVVLNGTRTEFSSRARAREYAAWERRHPSNVALRRDVTSYHDDDGNIVDGIPRIVDSWEEQP